MITYINAAGGYYFIKNTDIRIPYAYAKELANYDVMAVCEE
jgi:predicted porin